MFLAEPEKRKRFSLFDFAKVRMIGSNESAAKLDSGCKPYGVAQGNGVLRFQAGSLGKNYRVNGVNKLNGQRINLFENNAGLFFAQRAVKPVMHLNQVDSVHKNIGLFRQSIIEQGFYFIRSLFLFEQGNKGASVQDVRQLYPAFGKKLPELLFFEFLVLTAHFKEAVYRNGRIFTEILNFFQRGIKRGTFALRLSRLRFFLRKPMDFTAGGRSRRYFTWDINNQPVAGRYFYRLGNGHGVNIA